MQRSTTTITQQASAIAVALLSVLAPRAAEAQDLRDYRCSIERVTTATPQSTPELQAQQKAFVGRQFTVERRTGTMAGALKNTYITAPQVIDPGSGENSFKVVTTLRKEQGLGPGSNVHVLVVNEYEKSAAKPFVFLDNGDVYFGTCVHF
jgi:hypothetical protein